MADNPLSFQQRKIRGLLDGFRIFVALFNHSGNSADEIKHAKFPLLQFFALPTNNLYIDFPQEFMLFRLVFGFGPLLIFESNL
jgi:hypothetical protein